MRDCADPARRVQLKRSTSNVPVPSRASGFSLLELAITLAVLTVLLAGLLVPLSTQIAQRNETATQKILEDVREALLGFAAATGRLPCPATGATGVESFAAGSSASDGNCGNASGGAFIGFVPGVTLGLTQLDRNGFPVDAWGSNPYNRIRYAVHSEPLNNVQFALTKNEGMRTAGMTWIATEELLHVCASGTGVSLSATPPAGWHCSAGTSPETNTLTTSAPVVVWSTGANSATGGTSSDEIQNPNPVNGTSRDRIFVSRTRSANPEFDDLVTWLSASRLINRMIVAGQLP